MLKKQLQEAYNEGIFLESVIEIYNPGRHDRISDLSSALTELHNEGAINVNKEFLAVTSSSKNHNFFSYLLIYEACLPLLKTDYPQVIQCAAEFIESAGNDLAIRGIYTKFQEFCIANIEHSKDIVMTIISNGEESIPLLSESLIAASHIDKLWCLNIAKELTQDDNPITRWHAYNSIGYIGLSLRPEINDALTLLESACDVESSGEAIGSIPRAILSLGCNSYSYWARIEIALNKLHQNHEPEFIYAISKLLTYKQIILPSDIMVELVNVLTGCKSKYQGIINNIDHLLYDWLRHRDFDNIEALLPALLLNDSNISITSFNSFTSQLLTSHSNYLNKLTTQWFLSGEISLCKGISDLLHGISADNISLSIDKSITGNNSLSALVVARKAIGWLFTKPITCASLLISILEEYPEELASDIEELLYSPLLLSYTGSLSDYLEKERKQSKDKVVSQAIKRLLDRLEQYFQNLEGLPQIRELRAPRENSDLYWKRFNQSMQKAYDEAPRSIVFEICTVHHLLYGNSSATYIYDNEGASHRSEMQMSKVSHSTEFPRMSVVDPEGLDYTLRVYRVERIKNEANS